MRTETYQPKTGAACSCSPGQQRDNCPTCEGTGRVVDFAAIRAAAPKEATPRTAAHVLPGESERLELPKSEYDIKAEEFLSRNGITFRAAWHSAECPPWEEGKEHIHGDAYIVTLRRQRDQQKVGEFIADSQRRISFPFWNSWSDVHENKPLRAYSVLACISSDIYTPETFEDFCAEYGYDADSRKAEKLFKRADRFARRLRAFFTEEEQNELAEIQ